jgi:hypothetical protein
MIFEGVTPNGLERTISHKTLFELISHGGTYAGTNHCRCVSTPAY